MPIYAEERLHHNYHDSDSSEEDEPEEEEEDEEEKPEDLRKSTYGGCVPRRRVGWFWGKVLDPRATWVREWNRIFLLVCAAGLFVDPLFFYALSISDNCMCLFVDGWFAVAVTVLRSMTDALHLWNMWLQFKMNRRPHHPHGGGERESRAVHDSSGASARGVAWEYFKSKKGFFLDLFVILPLPQVSE